MSKDEKKLLRLMVKPSERGAHQLGGYGEGD